jgi:hypothetical protein
MSTGDVGEMTAAAIARLAGVGRAAVSNWRRRYPDFPQPVGGTAASPTFSRSAVEAWLLSTGKADQLATAGRTYTGTERVSYPETVTERSITDLTAAELLSRVMVSLLPRETSAGGEAPVVLDPACSEATLLLAVADRFGDRVTLAGQEISERLAGRARFNLGSNADGAAYEIFAGDSLLDDQLSQYLGAAAAVVCEPPFDLPQWPATELTTDPRWEFGIPAPRDSELAWVQHCYAHLRPRGVAVVAVSRRTCVQSSGERIRSALVRSGVLRTVISLPARMSSVPGTDVCLWVLQRPHGSADHGPVRMIDLSGLGDRADVPREFAAWQRLFRDTEPAISRAVPRLELLDSDACLLPARYVAAQAESSADDLAHVTQRLEALYATIGQGLPRFRAPQEQVKVAHVTLGELERVGALTVRPRDATPREGDVLLHRLGRPPTVATGTDADDVGVAQVVEIDETRLDAHFVATFLRSDVGSLPVANTLGAINRDDLRRCRIPRMSLPVQRRYGDAFRRLLELEAALRTLADVSEKTIEQTIHGLTTGALAPGGIATEGEPSSK